jgi:HAD superfamily hydrolase (TIGR01509 family)
VFIHYIWDFDGTLFDTYPHMAAAMKGALAELGVHETIEDVLRTLKRSEGACLTYYKRRNGLGNELDRFYYRYELPWSQVKPFPGAAEVCGAIVDRGAHNYLYTHRNRKALELLAGQGMERLFTDAITREDGFADKPAPDALLVLMERNGISPRDAVMIGDRDIDLLAGRNAGLAGCLFDPGGYYPDFPADFRVKSMAELKRLLLP